MKFQLAELKHLDRMCEIIDQAKAQLKSMGLDQWQSGYPNRDTWLQDIKEGCTYLAMEGDEVVGIFAFLTAPEASYVAIEGSWLTSNDANKVSYSSLHRVCVADGSKGKGIAGKMMQKAFELTKEQGIRSVRIDTHPGNIPMQRVIQKAGFTYCGKIYLVGGEEAGALRLAYEKVL